MAFRRSNIEKFAHQEQKSRYKRYFEQLQMHEQGSCEWLAEPRDDLISRWLQRQQERKAHQLQMHQTALKSLDALREFFEVADADYSGALDCSEIATILRNLYR